MQLKKEVNYLDYTYSKIVRQSLGLLACTQIYFLLELIAVPYMYGEEEYGFSCWASASQPKEIGTLGFVTVSGERHITPLSILMSIAFYSLGLKPSFVWSELYYHSQNLQKTIVNVFTSGIS